LIILPHVLRAEKAEERAGRWILHPFLLHIVC
jgi:hypothetical protein